MREKTRKLGFVSKNGLIFEELARFIGTAFTAHRFETVRVRDASDLDDSFELILFIGDAATVGKADQIMEKCTELGVRPVLWQLESMPPRPLRRDAVKTSLALLDIELRPGARSFRWLRRLRMSLLTRRLRRQTACVFTNESTLSNAALRMAARQFAWIARCKQRGQPVTVLASLRSRVTMLNEAGFSASFVPVGYHSRPGQRPENKDRDIDVLFIGAVSPGREHILRQVSDRISQKAGKMVVIRKGCYGDERTQLFNRSRIVLNIPTLSWEFPLIRFFMAPPCGCLIVSLPGRDTSPFIPGEHFVMANKDDLLDTIDYYLTHENERRRIAEQGRAFVTQHLTMEKTIIRELERLVGL